MTKFSVNWSGNCYVCRNPLDVVMDVDNNDGLSVLRELITFMDRHPIDLYQNHMMWKTRSGKVYKCCRYCQQQQWVIPKFRERENGTARSRNVVRSESRSEHEIYCWFKALYTYMNMDPEGKFSLSKRPKNLAQLGILVRLI